MRGAGSSRLDVFVVSYERPEWAREAVASLLRQTFHDYQLVVSDDSESDRVERALQEFRADPRFRYVRHPRRVGMVGNWNDCIRDSSAEYVALFHDDDVYHEEILARSVTLLDRNPAVGFVHSSGVYVREDGTEIAPIPHRWPAIVPGAEFHRRLARSRTSLVACSTVVARRRAYETVGLYREIPGPGWDKEMWMRMARVADVGFIEEPMIRNRVRTSEAGDATDWLLPAVAMILELSSEFLVPSYGLGLAGRLFGEIRFFARRNLMPVVAVMGLVRRGQVVPLRSGWPHVERFVSPPLRQLLGLAVRSDGFRSALAVVVGLMARLRRLARPRAAGADRSRG